MPRVNSEKFYTISLQKHGTTAKGVCWNSSANQQIRFEAILELLPKDLSTETVVDAGCGFGDFYNYLVKNGMMPKHYIGIDSLDFMCEIASSRVEANIIQADILKDKIPHAEYYICSGALNILTGFETYQFIRNCYLASKNGFIFNILHGEKQSETYNYISKVQIERIAKELGVADVIFHEGYIQNDITVGFFR